MDLLLSPTFAGALSLLIGLALVVVIIREWRAGTESESWPTVEGRVRFSELHRRRETTSTWDDTGDVGGGGRWRSSSRTVVSPAIWYEYFVDGRAYEGKNLGNGGPRRTAEETVAEYPPGATVRVHYNPKRPQQSALEPGVSFTAMGMLAVMALVLLGFGVHTLSRKASREVTPVASAAVVPAPAAVPTEAPKTCLPYATDARGLVEAARLDAHQGLSASLTYDRAQVNSTFDALLDRVSRKQLNRADLEPLACKLEFASLNKDISRDEGEAIYAVAKDMLTGGPPP